jgi:hypothetical protein
MTLLITVEIQHICNVRFTNVVSKVIISNDTRIISVVSNVIIMKVVICNVIVSNVVVSFLWVEDSQF